MAGWTFVILPLSVFVNASEICKERYFAPGQVLTSVRATKTRLSNHQPSLRIRKLRTIRLPARERRASSTRGEYRETRPEVRSGTSPVHRASSRSLRLAFLIAVRSSSRSSTRSSILRDVFGALSLEVLRLDVLGAVFDTEHYDPIWIGAIVDAAVSVGEPA